MTLRIRIASLIWLLTFAVSLNDSFWVSLWPSFVAISIVFLVNRALIGLLAGATSGILILHHGNPITGFISFFQDHLLPSLQSSWNLSILIFTLLLGGFVSLIEKGGGIRSLLHTLIERNKGGRKTLLWSAYSLGLICFFDGLANSLLVGKSLTSPARKLGVSGAKMAYIVDSTSSAVACVAIISTWIAYQLSMIREGVLAVNPEAEVQPFQLFLHSIPYNFYCWFTLALLAVVIGREWDIGPMRKHERKTTSQIETKRNHTADPEKELKPHYIRALIPLFIMIGGLLVGLYWDGSNGQLLPINFQKISEAYGAADAALVMLAVSALSCLVAWAMNAHPIRAQNASSGAVFMEGVIHLFQPILILVSAWIFSSTLKQLDTVSVIAGILEGNFPLWLFPMAVFVIGAIISFTTGTSWGTMGVLMPLSLPVAIHLSGDMESIVVLGTIAAVFSGAVFGDHCSPLSDTTIVSSIACEVEPVDHVKTQLPYALVAAATATLLGFLPVGLGLSPWIALPTGALLLIAMPSFLGTRTR